MSKKFISKENMKHTGANWNNKEDMFTQVYYEQNLSQFWRPEDISMQGDLGTWGTLDPKIQLAYAENLAFLTFLDTKQGDNGVNIISRAIDQDQHQRKAVLNFMAAMENAVHAKSYSNIFMTLMSTPEIDKLFVWTENNVHAQRLLTLISDVYDDLDKLIPLRDFPQTFGEVDPLEFNIARWKGMVASVFLESWLFYSGFYYPLWFYGQGELMQAGEIINLILRDESVHGLYIGQLAQELFEEFEPSLQEELVAWKDTYLEEIYASHVHLIEEIYDKTGLTADVKVFVRYNANKALMNLGFEAHFPNEEVNPVVLNGLNTETKTMDNFSMKGNGYQKMISEAISDDDFDFDFDF
ncbi:MAG: class 1b ribonucleoside-diphosphate reductase subunit beta [Erysipelothrix sp.]|nr:class 1b ribonucleoside-diphosphate reductase subunit beta [Erysipelothrix sp.]